MMFPISAPAPASGRRTSVRPNGHSDFCWRPRAARASRAMIPRMTSAGTHHVSVVVDSSRFPKLFRFVEWRIDVQLAEVRELLRLPMPEVGLESGQNFAAATSLVNLIAGRLFEHVGCSWRAIATALCGKVGPWPRRD